MTSKYNAGFKRHQRTEALLLLMRMEIEANMKAGKPSYILGFDVKGGYNNVNLALLQEKFDALILPKIREQSTSPLYEKATLAIFHHIINNPSMKIWAELDSFTMANGVQQGGICSCFLFILLADEFASVVEQKNTPRRHIATPYNWADDINTVCNDPKIIKEIIKEQRELSEKLELPFSADKTQLIIIYPRD